MARAASGEMRGMRARVGRRTVCLAKAGAALAEHALHSKQPTWPSMPNAAMVRMLVKASEAVWLARANVSSSLAALDITT